MALLLVIGLLVVVPRCYGQGAGDEAAIVEAALNYVDGWYEGDAERMEKALHPNLAKRMIRTHPKTGGSLLDDMSETTLLEYARGGGGKDRAKEGVENKVTVLDVFEGIATVKIVSHDFVDYAHLAKWNGEWVIINVLWAPLKASGER
jgi:hypothetical protein